VCFAALGVDDPGRAATFYRDVLGFVDDAGAELPRSGEHAVLRTASGQRLVLCRFDGTPQPPDLGRHTGYGVTRETRDAILRQLHDAGVTVETYEEDRTAERADNVYFRDPDGNRVQLVTAGRPGSIDHAGIQAIDIEWEEDLFVGLLGLQVEEVVGWRTDDYKRAVRWGEGLESMAPGTRRWDRRFAMRPGQGPMVARPNMQLFMRAGTDILGIFLAYERYQLPVDDQIVGIPRLGFAVAPDQLETIAARFAEAKLPTDGPHRHPAASPYRESLYARDRGGNFLEFCVVR
jgi:catechol 2,3-dioxygenase-like lactoylglutathione lyase family enzyme